MALNFLLFDFEKGGEFINFANQNNLIRKIILWIYHINGSNAISISI